MCLNPFVACVSNGEPMEQAGARQEPRRLRYRRRRGIFWANACGEVA